MLASSAATRRPRLLLLLVGPGHSMNIAVPTRNLPGGGLRRRGGWLHHPLLALALLVVALSVVGMHQLSLGHDFATPSAQSHQRATGHDPTQAGSAAPGHNRNVAPQSNAETHSHATSLVVADSRGASATAALSSDGTSSHDAGCPGCGQHTMAFSACLLALTLLVLSWLLAPPRVRLLPPMLPVRVVAVAATVARRVPALSLAELSLLRR